MTGEFKFENWLPRPLEESASLHRVTYIRALQSWKDGLGVLKYEQQRMQHKEDAWTKIHLWLDEHQQVRHLFTFI